MRTRISTENERVVLEIIQINGQYPFRTHFKTTSQNVCKYSFHVIAYPARKYGFLVWSLDNEKAIYNLNFFGFFLLAVKTACTGTSLSLCLSNLSMYILQKKLLLQKPVHLFVQGLYHIWLVNAYFDCDCDRLTACMRSLSVIHVLN